MESKTPPFPPGRISDLAALKKDGRAVRCQTSFDILPVDFQHRRNPFQAYIFLCRYAGTVDDRPFSFRKCYARGCPNNLCPHVSQAVMIANRYLQRDYHKLEQTGIQLKRVLFTLEDMTLKFEGYQETYGPILAIHDYINIAKEGNPAKVTVALESVPGVEHFVNHNHPMIFLMVDFSIHCLGKSSRYERCLACYHQQRQNQERRGKIETANARLALLYKEFDTAGVEYNRVFFRVKSAGNGKNCTGGLESRFTVSVF